MPENSGYRRAQVRLVHLGGGSEASPHPWQGLGDAAQEGPLGDGFRLLSSGPVV